MSTAKKNLSDYNMNDIPNAKGLRFSIIVSNWNKEITDRLLDGTIQTLINSGVESDDIFIIDVPGSFELLYASKKVMIATHDLKTATELEMVHADSIVNPNFDAIICLGSVIKGETKHFDFICNTVTNGIKDLNLLVSPEEKTPYPPVIFGVLTDDTYEQAINRSGGKYGNKGVEAAITAICMSKLKIRSI